MNPEISIVTTYYNRKHHLVKMLEILSKSSYRDFEVVIVDDASDEDHRLEELLESNGFPFDCVLVRIEPEEKNYTSPCVPFNIGFTYARGEKIIIQNPECIHVGDVLSAVDSHLKPNMYISVSCYSLGPLETREVLDTDFKSKSLEDIKSELTQKVYSLPQVACDGGDGTGYNTWYNHPKIRRNMYHFTSAIMKEDLVDLGGFDERYAAGIAYDDDEFKTRILRKGMDAQFVVDPMVIHLSHSNFNYSDANLLRKNEFLYNHVTKKEKGWSVKTRVNSDISST